jgi:hypothetical protein
MSIAFPCEGERDHIRTETEQVSKRLKWELFGDGVEDRDEMDGVRSARKKVAG